jgi:hypothetical protein
MKQEGLTGFEDYRRQNAPDRSQRAPPTQWHKITKATIVDATIVGAPSSTKNQDKKRDSEMHETAEGQQWYFGMKAHIGVDSRTKLIHKVLTSTRQPARSARRCRICCTRRRPKSVWGDYRGNPYRQHTSLTITPG